MILHYSSSYLPSARYRLRYVIETKFCSTLTLSEISMLSSRIIENYWNFKQKEKKSDRQVYSTRAYSAPLQREQPAPVGDEGERAGRQHGHNRPGYVADPVLQGHLQGHRADVGREDGQGRRHHQIERVQQHLITAGLRVTYANAVRLVMRE